MSIDTNFRPALSIVATAGKRQAMLDIAVEAETRGFSGIACPSLGGTMGLCVSLAHVTHSINYWTSIQPIYYSHPVEAANTCSDRKSTRLNSSHSSVSRMPSSA